MQFTLSRLLASTALIAFGVAGATLPLRISEDDWNSYAAIPKACLLLHCWTSGAVIGGAFGVLFKRPGLGAICGIVATLILFLVAVIAILEKI